VVGAVQQTAKALHNLWRNRSAFFADLCEVDHITSNAP
jgi:hypothetical protein